MNSTVNSKYDWNSNAIYEIYTNFDKIFILCNPGIIIWKQKIEGRHVKNVFDHDASISMIFMLPHDTCGGFYIM